MEKKIQLFASKPNEDNKNKKSPAKRQDRLLTNPLF